MQDLKLLKFVKIFMENPYEEYYLRQLAKKTELSVFAVKKYADILLKHKFVMEERKANLRYLRANTNNLFFRHIKIAYNLKIISDSGLIEFLKQNLTNVSSIVLFGSVANGGDDKNSDVDLVVVGKYKHLDLDKFEKKINKDINLHIFSWGEWNKKAKEDNAFYIEVISYGISLHGELPIVTWK